MTDTSYLNDLFSLKNKTILITGATGQLGQEITKAFVSCGSTILATDKDINERGKIDSENITYSTLDIADGDSVRELFESVYSKEKQIDCLVNNAGVSTFDPFLERKEEDFDWVMDVNLKGTFNCIKTFASFARKQKHEGSIVNIGSIYGVVSPDPRIYTDTPRHNSEVYGATKAGVIQMTKYFATHLAQDNIRVNCISPGGIYNPEHPQGEDFVKNYSQRCPMGRMARVEDFVGGVLYAASDAAQYLTGQNITIDGGFSSW